MCCMSGLKTIWAMRGVRVTCEMRAMRVLEGVCKGDVVYEGTQVHEGDDGYKRNVVVEVNEDQEECKGDADE